MIKNAIHTVSEKKNIIRQKAIVFGGTAVGAIIAYAMLSKSNATDPNTVLFEEEAAEIIKKSKATAKE